MDKGSHTLTGAKFSSNRTIICSVVFLDIVEYSKKPVMEQIELKECFNSLLAEYLKDIPVNDRIILDTGDGAALSFLGDPEDALFVAMGLRDAFNNEQKNMPHLQVRMGINLGPVKMLKDINNQVNLIGDGINVAQRIMSFAEPGQLLVSRSYYDIISCLSQEYARLFQYKGARADKHIREHDIYAVEQTGLRPQFSHHHTNAVRPVIIADEAINNSANPFTSAAQDRPTPAQSFFTSPKRKFLLAGGLVLAIIIIALAVFIFNSKTPVLEHNGRKAAGAKPAKAARPATRPEAPVVKASESVESVHAEAITEEKIPTRHEAFKPASVTADDMEFIFSGIKIRGGEIIISLKISNHSGYAKSVALYDDYFRWTKSKVIDISDKTYDVAKVNFIKNGQITAMSASGTQGFSIGPNEAIQATLSFKKPDKKIKVLNIHPFIYQGRSWKEHDLMLNPGR